MKKVFFQMLIVLSIAIFIVSIGILIGWFDKAEAQPIDVSTDRVATRYAYDDEQTPRLQYVGECLPRYQRRGSEEVWRIKKYTYVGSSTNIASIHWASRTPTYTHAWNSRETYTY